MRGCKATAAAAGLSSEADPAAEWDSPLRVKAYSTRCNVDIEFCKKRDPARHCEEKGRAGQRPPRQRAPTRMAMLGTAGTFRRGITLP